MASTMKRREKYKGYTIKIEKEDGKKRHVVYDKKDRKIGSNKTRSGAQRRIRKHRKKPESVKARAEAKEKQAGKAWRVVDTYNGIPIEYQPSKDRYRCKVEGTTKYGDDPDELHAFIDKQTYKNSATYQAKQDEKSQRQQEGLKRARIYGIGTDDEGNPVEPTPEQIEARETFYAKEKLDRGTTLREEHEEERGVIPSEEELILRDEARQEEAEARGDIFSIFLYKIQAEWRQLRGMF